MRRSMLFLPGNNPNMLINGNCLGSDAVIFDLEDAVAPSEKDAARILVRNTMKYLDFRGCEIIVRINSIDTEYWMQDVDEILPYKPNLILLPKTNGPQDVLAADAYICQVEEKLGYEKNTVGLMPLIETALGVENAFAIASALSRNASSLLLPYGSCPARIGVKLSSIIISKSVALFGFSPLRTRKRLFSKSGTLLLIERLLIFL